MEWVEISIFFDNTHKKYHIIAGISSFVVMKKFAYRTEDSELSVESSINEDVYEKRVSKLYIVFILPLPLINAFKKACLLDQIAST